MYAVGMTNVELTGSGGKTPTPESEEFLRFEQLVRDACKDRCSNCGGQDRLRVKMVVPEGAGGKRVVSNGILLCRPCELAADSLTKENSSKRSGRRILNFWVSRKLYDRIQAGLEARQGFTSVSSLVRYLMSKYVSDEARFDDLEQYQDVGTDVKINVWVDTSSYATFKLLVDKRGMTVTDAVKGLVLMYGNQAEPLVQPKEAL